MLLNAEGIKLNDKNMMDLDKEDEYLVPCTCIVNIEQIQYIAPSMCHPGYTVIVIADETFRVPGTVADFVKKINEARNEQSLRFN